MCIRDSSRTLAEHAAGNYRVLVNMGSQLLDEAARQNATQIDDKTFFELFPSPARTARPRPSVVPTRS